MENEGKKRKRKGEKEKEKRRIKGIINKLDRLLILKLLCWKLNFSVPFIKAVWFGYCAAYTVVLLGHLWNFSQHACKSP